MAFDVCVTEIDYPQHPIIMAQFSEDEFDFVNEKVKQHNGLPILKRCFKNLYYDAKVEVVELNVFQAEVTIFSKTFLPADENFDKILEQLSRVIDVAIELQRPIEMQAD